MTTESALRSARPTAREIAPALVFGTVAACCAVGLLALSAFLIVRAGEQVPLAALMGAIVGVRALALGRAAFRYLERVAGHDGAFRTLARLRARMFERLIPVAPDGLRRVGRGDLLSGLVSDVDELQNLVLRIILPLGTSTCVAAISVVCVWMLLPAAGLILAVALVVALIGGTLLNHVVSGHSARRIAPLRAQLADAVHDQVTALDVLTAYGALEQSSAGITKLDSALRLASFRGAAASGAAASLVTLIAGVAVAGTLAAGIGPVGAGVIGGPVLALIVLVPVAVFDVFGMVPLALSSWRSVHMSAQRIDAVVPARVPSGRSSAVDTRIPVGAGIALSRMSVTWPFGDSPALTDINLHIHEGERVVITGESGAGKTTLAHALVRFLEHSGWYELGGLDVELVDAASTRRVVGLCEQRPHLFDNTIRNNLLLARDGATDDQLIDSLRRVGLDEWAERRGGLDAAVGERGALVSGGQAQRIALARALLAEVPVLILDEPTANVDADRADSLLRSLLDAASTAGRTIILITHLPVPDALVTRRIHLEHGRIAWDSKLSGTPVAADAG